MKKRNICTKLTAIVLIVLMMSMMTMSVFADSKTVTPNYGAKTSTVTIRTAYQYRWFWQARKTMAVTVKNTGSCLISLYMKPLDKDCESKVFPFATVSAGEEKTVYILPYDSCRYQMTISYNSISSFNRGAIVTTSAGSVTVS